MSFPVPQDKGNEMYPKELLRIQKVLSYNLE